MGRPVIHWEFWSKDPRKLMEFYQQVFDWQDTLLEEMNYHLVNTDSEDGINGGMMTPKQGPWPSNMTLYIDVDDLDEYVDRIKEAGGKIVVERMDVPEVGTLALFEDPDGRVLGIWQRREQDAAS